MAHRNNEWDEKSLGIKVNEIIEIEAKTEDLDNLIKNYLKYCSVNSVDFSTVRVNEEDRKSRNILENNGFKMKEISYTVRTSKQKLNSNKSYNLIKNRLIKYKNEFAHLCTEDELLKLSFEMFDHGRFTEDPEINTSSCHRRNDQWAQSLLKGKDKKLFLKINGKLAAFMFYQEKGNEADLVLAGVAKEHRKSGAAYNLWVQVLSSLKEDAQIKTCISAANFPILNLYMSLGFKVSEALVGYHKFYSNEKPL